MLFHKHKFKHSSDEELMLFIVNRADDKAFDELYSRYSKPLHYFFYRMLNADREKANDMLQDLFMKVIEKGHLFDRAHKFSSWLYFIAGNMCKNEYRRVQTAAINNTEPNWENISHHTTIHHGHYDKHLFTKQLNETLNKLEEEQRLTFVLRYQQDLSIKEIADIMNCAEGTVKSRVYYTLRKLAQQLQAFKNGLREETGILNGIHSTTISKTNYHEEL